MTTLTGSLIMQQLLMSLGASAIVALCLTAAVVRSWFAASRWLLWLAGGLIWTVFTVDRRLGSSSQALRSGLGFGVNGWVDAFS